MERLIVPVPAMVADALRELAWREDRDPRRQAARLLQEGLERAGVLAGQTDPATSPDGPRAA